MTTPLEHQARIAAEMRAQIAAEFHLGEEDEAVTDTLEGLSDLPELIAAADKELARAEAHAEGLAGLIKSEQARKARLEAKAERLRSAIAFAMQEAGFRKLSLPMGTLSLSQGKPTLVITEDNMTRIPPEFKKVTESPDKAAIREALARGEQLDFAHLGNAAPTLTIRRR